MSGWVPFVFDAEHSPQYTHTTLGFDEKERKSRAKELGACIYVACMHTYPGGVHRRHSKFRALGLCVRFAEATGHFDEQFSYLNPLNSEVV